MNSHGVPSMKELFKGVMIDVDSSPNRHLAQAQLHGRVLHLELVEIPADLEDDEEGEFEEDEGEGEEEEFGDPLGLMPEGDDEVGYGEEEDEEDEEAEGGEGEACTEYPDACPTCEDLDCGHEVDDLDDEELTDVELRVTVMWPAFSGTPETLDEEIIEENPALCRFLNQIKDHNDL